MMYIIIVVVFVVAVIVTYIFLDLYIVHIRSESKIADPFQKNRPGEIDALLQR